MKNYIILTNQGFTESPKNQEIENQQVLGYINSDSEYEVIEKFVKENPWILEKGFSKNEMIVRELLQRNSNRLKKYQKL